MNDSLYNPDTMSKEEIKALFVARQPLLDELVSTIRNQPTGAGVQHLLIIAPRGMGKTTMLLMLQFAVEDNADLSKNWQAVRFPEESYDITELADFWLKVLDYLDDESLKPKIEEIEKRFPNGEDLREAAWAMVKDWSKKNKKRILLLIDNFDMILDQIGNDVEQARLRDILMNDGTLMFIGCAPSYFHQIQDYQQPFYNFFKISNLSDLKFPDIEELIRRRAEIDQIPDIEELLQKNRTRIKALETFTGGNPRLVLMLYRIIASSDMTEVSKGLERLLDAVTPFYKDKTEKLPPQQRKIINEIAQYSLEKNEGISPTEIAKKMRTTPNQISAQLKRLSENGYVRALNIRGRSSFYVLSEPLYAIWAQMRFGRNAREKRNWLVQILKALFDVQEIEKEIVRVSEKYIILSENGNAEKALGTLEFLICLLEADENVMRDNFTIAVYGYLELGEVSSIKKELSYNKFKKLPKDLVELLKSKNIINKEVLEEYQNESFAEFFTQFLNFIGVVMKEIADGHIDKALSDVDEIRLVFERKKGTDWELYLAIIYSLRSGIVCSLGKYEEAIVNANETNQILDKYISNEKEGELEERGKDFFKFFKALAYFIKSKSFFSLREMTNALENIDNTLQSLSSITTFELPDQMKIFSEHVYLDKILLQMVGGYSNEVLPIFSEYVSLVKLNEPTKWLEKVSLALMKIIRFADKNIILKMIEENNLLREFSPMSLALDYLETKDETIVEKLSPEIRIVVEETIKTLQMIEVEKIESESNKKDRASKKSKSLALSD